MGGIAESIGATLEARIAGGSAVAIAVAFLLGVFVGFTPCVYPILPIAVACIGRLSGGRKRDAFIYSLLYVLGMALVYATVGIVTAALGGQLGAIWNNGWFLLAFANFFLLMALWQLKVIVVPVPRILGGATPRAGALGALGVGAASGLVVGPCAFPGLAAVLALIAAGAKGGSAGSLVFGAAMMFAYSLGLGALIILCGAFSGVLAGLPKSGRWLEVVEKSFAILLILVAEFFLVYLGQNSNFPLLGSLWSAAAAGGN